MWLFCTAQAREEAARQTKVLSDGKASLGPLAGVPFGVKDLEDVEGLPTSYGAAPLRDNIAKQDSVVVERLRAAGAIVVGKTNTPLFGSTAYTKNLLYGVTRNPWNLNKTPGGSSGGSSAAIASKMVPLATAADGGGSIRIPATYVGAFGLKPSFGRVPMTEGEQFGMTKWVDCVHFGPLTRTVADAALFMDITVGYSPRDPNSLPHPGISYAETTAVAASTGAIPALAAGKTQGVSVEKLRVGWSATLGYISATDPNVLAACEAALDVFRQKGCAIIDLDLNLIDLGRDWGAAMGAQEYQLRSIFRRVGSIGRPCCIVQSHLWTAIAPALILCCITLRAGTPWCMRSLRTLKTSLSEDLSRDGNALPPQIQNTLQRYTGNFTS